MAIQLIRLSQIKSNLAQFMDFEQQVIAMYGSEDTLKLVATEGQQTFILNRDYLVGRNSIKVFVNGLLQNVNEGYIETNSRMITFSDPLYKDDVVVIIFNIFNSFAQQIGHERVKGYQILRQTYFITDSNVDNLVYKTPTAYQPGLNQLKVYVNGLLRTCGSSYDYTETDENSFTLNGKLPVGSTLTVEVISGGLMIYKCDRYAVFIDQNKITQRNILLPTSYKPGSNNLKVYLNGQLLRPGYNNDYMEVDETSFNMNRDLPLGSVLEAEVTTFTVDVFNIYRVERITTSANSADMVFTTVVPYDKGESNLRVYLNGVLLREGTNEDYSELSDTSFKLNFGLLPVDSIVEYEIITW